MDLLTAIGLIKCAEIQTDSATTWADLGCGTGLFTKALSTFLQPSTNITAVDKDAAALKVVQVADNHA